MYDRFAVARLALGQVFLRVFSFFLSVSFHQAPYLSLLINSQHCCLGSSGACTRIKSQSNASVQSVACQLSV